jgi:hypothetical protein
MIYVNYSVLVQRSHLVWYELIEKESVMVMLLVGLVDENEDFEFFHQFLNYVH